MLKVSGLTSPSSPTSSPTTSRAGTADEHLGAGRDEVVARQVDALGEVRADRPAQRREQQKQHAPDRDAAVDAARHDQDRDAREADKHAEHRGHARHAHGR